MASRLGLPMVFLSLFAAVSGADVRRPPAIDKGPTAKGKMIVFRTNDDITIDCEASGSPSPTYTWYMNKEKIDFNLRRNLKLLHPLGSIRISPTSILDEGYYQCIAENMYGKAMSDVLVFKRAFLGSARKTGTRTNTATEGESARMACEPVEGYPKPVYYWQIGVSPEATEWTRLVMDGRLSTDDRGTLHFAHVTPADHQGGKIYKCNIFNNYVDLTRGGSYTKLMVTPDSAVTNRKPQLSFKTGANLVAFEGESINITCIFSGRPAPSHSWQKVGGVLPPGRYRLLNNRHVLTIQKVEPGDAGTYRCTAANEAGSDTADIAISVQSRPEFTRSPENVNATEEKSVSILCQTKAKPPAQVKWYKNGDLVDLSRLPERWAVTDMNTNLTITKLQKNNPNAPQAGGDLMNIQCNASNDNGYVFADAYLNVLLKTRLLEIPENQSLANNTEKLILRCKATSDPSTPVKIDWLKNDGYIVYNEVYYKDADGNLVLDVKRAKQRDFAGKYTCIASNGYDAPIATAYVSDPYPEVANAGLWWWWIIVVVALLLLLIILILICCHCCMKNREYGYPVDQKERQWGHDPEKELLELGFKDYQRLDEDEKKRSRPDVTDEYQGPEDRRPIYKGDKKLKPPPSQRFESDA